MLTMIQSQQARIETLDQDIHNLRGDNDDLERELTKKQGTIEYLEQQRRQPSVTPSTESTTHNTKGRARLEDPDKFSRKKGHQPEFETWKSNIETKLKVDSRLFDDKNHKISYVYSRTTNEAQDHIRDRVDNDHFDISWGSTFGSPIIFGDFGGRESQVRVPCLMC
jgi:predicted RNase H-like nuclease (RuvC/YqgF family)